MKHKFKSGWKYLTQWKNFPVSNSTWEPLRSFVLEDGKINTVFEEYCRNKGLTRALVAIESLSRKIRSKDHSSSSNEDLSLQDEQAARQSTEHLNLSSSRKLEAASEHPKLSRREKHSARVQFSSQPPKHVGLFQRKYPSQHATVRTSQVVPNARTYGHPHRLSARFTTHGAGEKERHTTRPSPNQHKPPPWACVLERARRAWTRPVQFISFCLAFLAFLRMFIACTNANPRLLL